MTGLVGEKNRGKVSFFIKLILVSVGGQPLSSLDIPHVSVIVVTKDRPLYLKKCLESLANQTYPKNKLDVIVVDGGKSFSVTRLFNENLNLTYAKQNDLGIPQARNIGLRAAKGEIIAFIDDDCVANKNWITEGVKSFSNDEIGIVQGKTTPGRVDFSIRDCLRKRKVFFLSVEIVAPMWNYQTCNIFYRKTAITSVGEFDIDLQSGEDSDFGLRVTDIGYKNAFAAKAIVYHSVIPTSFLSLIKYSSQAFYCPLLVKKHSVLRKKLFLLLFWSPSDFWLTMALISIVPAILISPLFSIIVAIYASKAFLGINASLAFSNRRRGAVYRLLAIPFFVVKDFYNLAFFIAGSLKYKCFVL